jgi:cytochrome oxidase Cu insertion factor (SCO1/SenC/PrrC family)
MRYLLAGALGLTLLAPAWADDKKTDKADDAPKTPKEQVTALGQAYQKEMRDLSQQFQAATTAEEKDKIKDKALKQVPAEFAKKAMALAADHPKDPAAVDALLWVCTTQFVSQTPEAKGAFKALLKDHADSDKLAGVCEALSHQPDGDRMIRQVMAKATNPAVKAQAGFYLAQALQEKDDATAEQTKEAEKLLEELVAKAKAVKGVPPEMIEEADGMLKLFVGRPAPASTAKDLDDKAVALADLKGKVVVLDFWFTQCGWCVKMLPHEREMVKKLADKPFVLVSVSVDPRAQMVKDFVEKEPMPWTHWFAGQQGAITKTWRIQGYPTFYVIDAKGVIRGKVVGGGAESEKKLEELVEKVVKEADGKGAE